MSNRMITILMLILLFAVGILLLMKLIPILYGTDIPQEYLQYNSVRGMAIQHEGKNWTLNFSQKNQVISALNQGIPTAEVNKEQQKGIGFEKLIIYLFNKPDIELIPVGIINNEIVFYANQLTGSNTLLKENSDGTLRKMIENSYDH